MSENVVSADQIAVIYRTWCNEDLPCAASHLRSGKRHAETIIVRYKSRDALMQAGRDLDDLAKLSDSVAEWYSCKGERCPDI